MHPRSLEYSGVITDRARKRTLAVTEELGLDQGFRQGGQVYRAKTVPWLGRELTGFGIIGDEARKPDCPGHDFFA